MINIVSAHTKSEQLISSQCSSGNDIHLCTHSDSQIFFGNHCFPIPTVLFWKYDQLLDFSFKICTFQCICIAQGEQLIMRCLATIQKYFQHGSREGIFFPCNLGPLLNYLTTIWPSTLNQVIKGLCCHLVRLSVDEIGFLTLRLKKRRKRIQTILYYFL